MNRKTGKHSLTDHLAALGDVVRLRILRLLEREELSVGEVAKVVQLPQSTVSRHLKVLADGGWVFKRTEGTAAFYRVVLDDLPSAHRGLWVAVRDLLVGPAAAREHAAELDEDTRRLASVLADRRGDAQAYFGRLAGQWDDVRAELFGSRFTLLGLLHLFPRDWTVADLGCGTGNASELLAPLVGRVIAVDQSQPMLSAARKRLEGVRNVEFVKGELSALPLADASVDACVCVLVLHHVERPEAALAQMHRVLRPGGQALIVDMVEHDRAAYRHSMGHRHQGFSEPAMLSFVRSAGLERARYLPLPTDSQARGPGLFALTCSRPAASR
jgi:ArsR family transcriptional regulator